MVIFHSYVAVYQRVSISILSPFHLHVQPHYFPFHIIFHPHVFWLDPRSLIHIQCLWLETIDVIPYSNNPNKNIDGLMLI